MLQKICEDKKISVLVVEETHQQEPNALKLYGYRLAHVSSSRKLVRNSIRFSDVATSAKGAHTEWSTIKIHSTCITNVYQPQIPSWTLASFR